MFNFGEEERDAASLLRAVDETGSWFAHIEEDAAPRPQAALRFALLFLNGRDQDLERVL